MIKARKAVLTILFGMALLPVLAGGTVAAETGGPDPALDPIVAQVVEMLDADVSETVILQWLEATDRRPGDVGSPGLIALTEAGASQKLISGLLSLVGRTASPPPVSPEAVAPFPESSEELAVEAEPAATSSTGSDSAESRILLSAKRVWVDEDEPDAPREERWSVYLYLDGELVSWVRPTLQGEPVETGRVIRSGHHELRVVLQRYEEGRKGWRYESLSVPTLIEFEVQPEDPIEIEVEMRRIWGLWRQRNDGGPLSYVIRQGDRVLAEDSGTGGDPDRWQPVCEDVEANFPGSEKVPSRFRSQMGRCFRWDSLWTGAGTSTSRADILRQLAEVDFEPPVR